MKTIKRPTARGTRGQPPPDPQKKTVDLAPTRPTAYSNIRQPQDSTTTLLLVRLMPNACAALLTNGAIISGLGQALPAVAVAIVSMIEGAR